MAPQIAVIGAGIIGLSTAVLAQEKIPGLQVTLISETFSPHTTGDGAAGFWEPYFLKDTPASDIMRWSSKTYSHMLKLWQSVDAGEVGVSLVPAYRLVEKLNGAYEVEPGWSKIPLAFYTLGRNQTQKLPAGKNLKLESGTHFISFTLEASRYLPYLTDKFKLYGGKILQKKVESLHEFCGQQYDAVINCTGVQSCHLVGDLSVSPVRGQVLRVNAPWVFHMVCEMGENESYIIPNEDVVILGGTKQEGNWNTKPDPIDSKNILQGCYKLMPGLKDAAILNEWAGLRPSRPKVRLERECITDKYGNTLQVIHNYGHGGAGITLSHGCAHEAVAILQDILNDHPSTRTLSSKL